MIGGNMVGDYKDRYILIDVEESHEKIDVDLEAIGLKEDGLKQVEEKKIGRKPIQKTVLAEPIGFLFHEENDGYRLRTAPEPQKKRPHVGDTLEIEVNVHTTIASPDPHARKPRVPVHEIQDFKIVEGDRVIDEDKKEDKDKLECNDCGYNWSPRTENPAQSPKCGSREWDE